MPRWMLQAVRRRGSSSMNSSAGPRHGFGCNCAWCLQGLTGPAPRRWMLQPVRHCQGGELPVYTIADAKVLERAALILERRKGRAACADVTRVLRDTARNIRADAKRESIRLTIPLPSGGVITGDLSQD